MAQPLTIGMPISSFLPNIGGAEVGLHNIATHLSQRGHRPIIIVSWPHYQALKATYRNLPYKVVPFPPKIWGLFRIAPRIGFLLLDATLAQIHRRFGIDVWHGTIGYPSGVALTHFASKRNLPHIVRCVGDDIQVDHEIGYGMRLDPQIDANIRVWLPKANRLIAITESVAEEYRMLGISNEHITHIPNGVDLERFRTHPLRSTPVRHSYNISPDAFLFLCVGRNHPKKNFDVLLKAFSMMEDHDSHVALVGEGIMSLHQMARDLQILDRVHLIETVRESNKTTNFPQFPSDGLLDLYFTANAFVFPSRLETFGVVLAEAMAAALPIITTDAPGCRDVVRHNQDGISVPANNATALAKAMDKMRANHELRARLSAAALSRASQFSWDAITSSYLALYEELIQEH